MASSAAHQKSFSYRAIRVVQRPGATPFYLLSAPAQQILQWADVPRKKAQYMAGYQRELDDRHERITKYIEQSPLNVIPGAVIVALEESALKVEDDKAGGITITITHRERDVRSLIQDVYEQFLKRLSESEKASISQMPAEVSESELEEEGENDESIPQSYIAQLAAELRVAKDSNSTLPPERRAAVEDFVKGVSKPGLILDGQHRVFGAKDVLDFDVELPIVLMPGLPFAEQVFHFYVLNNKARPLRPTELRSTVSTSLTNKEIDELHARLRTSGVKAEEARWTYDMNNNAHSPFKGLIDFGLRDDVGFIPENVAYQVVSAFMKPPKNYKLLIKDVTPWEESDGVYKMSLFFAFWKAIATTYPKAWADGQKKDGNRQIFYKASMLCLQEYLLETMVKAMPSRLQKKQGSPFNDPKELESEVRSNLYFLSEEFFTREWTETGLDTPERRRFLKGQIEEAISRQSQKLGSMALFKAKAKKSGK
jgi:hypothetical protein